MNAVPSLFTPDWDANLVAMGGSGLQGSGWGQFVVGQGHRLVGDAGDGWSWAGQIQATPLGNYIYIPYGPTVRDEVSWKAVEKSIRRVAAAQSALFVRAEPRGITADALAGNWRKVGEWQPEHTSIINLTQTEELLRRGLKSGHRSAVNGAARRGLVLDSSTAVSAIDPLIQMLTDTAARGKWHAHNGEYLRGLWQTLAPRKQAVIYTASHDGKPVAAGLAFDFGRTRTYLHAGSYPEARTLQAAVPLVWAMVLDAKAAGCTQFDLGGVAPEGAPSTHPWMGFTQFKQGFGGLSVKYAGTWELPLQKLKYNAYRAYKKVRNR